jgi:hypothetical protein
MTTKDLQKRNEKAQNLRVLQANGTFFVESGEGMVLYKVIHDGDGKYTCTCGDYARGVKQDPNFQCKHILSVLNSVVAGDAEDGEFLERKKPKLDERFIKTIEGRDFVLYSGLLDLAHQKKLNRIEVDILQYPTKENGNSAVCKANAYTSFGEVFSDLGDANPLNCNAKVGKHLIRMASTRAKARALRDMTNIGLTALEELGDLDEVIGEEASEQAKSRKPFPKRTTKPVESQAAEGPKAEKGNGSNGGNGSSVQTKAANPKPEESKPTPKPDSKTVAKQESKPESAPKMSTAQKNAIYNLSRRRGISVEELENMARQNYGGPLESLSSTNASAFIRTLQQSA